MAARNIIGNTLRQARLNADFTQQQIADALGISLWTYNRVERGRRSFANEWVALLPQAVRQPVLRLLTDQHERQLAFLRGAARISRPTATGIAA